MGKRINQTFYVSVEGESELYYLDHLLKLINEGEFAYTVNFVKKVSLPNSFAKSIHTGFSSFPFYHICDYEGNSISDIASFKNIINDLNKAKNIVGKNNYKLIYTNLCFELWLILHKKDFRKSFQNKDEYLKEINNAYNLNISSWSDLKRKANITKILDKISINDIKDAIARAKYMKKYNNTQHELKNYKACKYYKENPSTNIHEFVEKVFKECSIM